MKRIIIHIILIIIAFIVYLLQANLFSWFTIAGIMPNLFLIYILFIGLFAGKIKGAIYGIIIGLFLDFTVGNTLGMYAVGLGLVGFSTGILDKNFSKDSRMTIMFMVATITVSFEIVMYFANYLILETNIELIKFFEILLIELLYNLILTIIFYPLMQKFGFYIENEYKENKILTRYF